MLERMVLKAELFHERGCIVAHTTAIGPSSVFVRTDEPVSVGEHVTLRLSFPGLFAPLQLDARVASRDAGNGPGYYAGFTLDFASEERIARLLETTPDARPSSFRILLVEDSAVMCDVVTQTAAAFSRTFHIETTSAHRAEAALAILEQDTFDLAVVDLYLVGEKSGADLVREMRARRFELPVIGFSIGGSSAKAMFLEAGVDLFLDKPIALRDVFATLEKLSNAARRPA